MPWLWWLTDSSIGGDGDGGGVVDTFVFVVSTIADVDANNDLESTLLSTKLTPMADWNCSSDR